MRTDWYKGVNPNLDRLAQILGMGQKPSHGYTIAEKAPEVVTAPGVYFPAEKGEVIPLESRQGGGEVDPKEKQWLGSTFQGSPLSPFASERKIPPGFTAMFQRSPLTPFGSEQTMPSVSRSSPTLTEPPSVSSPPQESEIPDWGNMGTRRNRRPAWEPLTTMFSREKGGTVTPSSSTSKDNESRKLDILESIIASIKPAGLESNSLMGLVVPPEPLKIEQSKYDILKQAISILKPPVQQKSTSGGGGSSQTKTPSPKSPSPNTGVNLPTPPTLPTVPTSMEGIPTPQSIQPEIRTDSPEINPMSGNLVNLNREDNLSTQMFPRQGGGKVTPSFEEWRKKYPADWSEKTLKSLAIAEGTWPGSTTPTGYLPGKYPGYAYDEPIPIPKPEPGITFGESPESAIENIRQRVEAREGSLPYQLVGERPETTAETMPRPEKPIDTTTPYFSVDVMKGGKITRQKFANPDYKGPAPEQFKVGSTEEMREYILSPEFQSLSPKIQEEIVKTKEKEEAKAPTLNYEHSNIKGIPHKRQIEWNSAMGKWNPKGDWIREEKPEKPERTELTPGEKYEKGLKAIKDIFFQLDPIGNITRYTEGKSEKQYLDTISRYEKNIKKGMAPMEAANDAITRGAPERLIEPPKPPTLKPDKEGRYSWEGHEWNWTKKGGWKLTK